MALPSYRKAKWYARHCEVFDWWDETEEDEEKLLLTFLKMRIYRFGRRTIERTFCISGRGLTPIDGDDQNKHFSGFWADTGVVDRDMYLVAQEWNNTVRAKNMEKKRDKKLKDKTDKKEAAAKAEADKQAAEAN